jgi:hypothetical protein
MDDCVFVWPHLKPIASNGNVGLCGYANGSFQAIHLAYKLIVCGDNWDFFLTNSRLPGCYGLYALWNWHFDHMVCGFVHSRISRWLTPFSLINRPLCKMPQALISLGFALIL